MAGQVVVTGATGNVGRKLAESLLASGVAVKAIGRTAERLTPLAQKGASTLVASLGDAAQLERAFAGAVAVFAMVPPSYTDNEILASQARMVDALAKAVASAKVPRVVALSSIGAELPAGTGPIVSVHRLEQALSAVGGLNLVCLRPAYFMENHLAGIGLIKQQGINGNPLLPERAIPQVATRDIAAAAAELLRAGQFTGKSVRYLLGPRDYTPVEASAILGRAIGKPGLPFVRFEPAAARQGLITAGVAPRVADLFVEMYAAMNEQRIVPETRSPANTTATTRERFASDTFAPAFRG